MKNVIVNRAKFDIMPDNKDVHKGKSVLCITTGEVFKSAKEAREILVIILISHIRLRKWQKRPVRI